MTKVMHSPRMRHAVAAVCPLWAFGWFGATFGQALDREVLQRAKQATVLVLRLKRASPRIYVTSGSGFFVSPGGFIVTNGHVVGGARQVTVVVRSGLPVRRVLVAEVVKVDRVADLAVLRTPEAAASWLLLSDEAEPAETTQVYALGFRRGLAVAQNAVGPAVIVTEGAVTSLPRGPDGAIHRIETDAAVSKGLSGGPLIGASGRVLGVVVCRAAKRARSGIAQAIPVSRLRAFLGDVPLTARAAYEAAESYSKRQPDDLRGVCARFAQVAKGWPGSSWAAAAERRRGEVAATWDRLAEAEFARLAAVAKARAARSDYEGAVAALREFPERLRSDRWSRRVEAAVRQYVEAQREAAERRRRTRELQDILWRIIGRHMRKRDYDEALGAARELLRGRKGAEVEQCRAQAADIIAAAEEFWGAVQAGAAHGRAKEVRVKGMLYEIAGAEGDTLVLRLAGTERRVAVRALTVDEALPLAEWRGPAGRLRLALACLYAFEAQWEKALTQAGAVEESQRLELAGLIKLWRAEHARRLLRQAEAALAAGRPQRALPALRELRDSCADLDLVRERMAWIDATLATHARQPEPSQTTKTPSWRVCPKCGGAGYVSYARKRLSGLNWVIDEGRKLCPACNGRGRLPATADRPSRPPRLTPPRLDVPAQRPRR